jgi:ClpP class serine protease
MSERQNAATPRPAMIHPAYGAQVQTARALAAAPAKNGMYALEDSSEKNYKPYAFVDGIAIIGVHGYLTDCMPWWGSRYVTGYDALRFQSARAFDDDDVKGIVLNVDSYGGLVAGCFDFIDEFAERKAASGKPVAAILSEQGYSAAYAIPAGCADSISVPRTGGVGSVGVVAMHVDIAGALEKWGEKVTLIAAGAHKVDGNPYQALPDAVRDEIKAELEDVRRLFAETVVRGRIAAGAKLTVEDVLATEARTYDGPAMVARAVTLGLVDAVASPAKAFEAFSKYVNSEGT